MTILESLIETSPALLPNTKRAYLGAVRSFLEFASRDPRRWTGPAVEAWRDRLRAEGRKPQTVNLHLRALKYASRRLAQRQRDPALDFAGYAERLREDAGAKEVPPLALEEARALVAACEGPRPLDLRDTAIVVLMIRTGLRRDSVCQIQLDDLQGKRLRVWIKGRKRHQFYLDDETLAAIAPWRAWLARAGARSGALFRGFRGRPGIDGDLHLRAALSADGLFRALELRARAAGVQKFHPHRLRHTFITWARQGGIPDWRIAQVTGHAIDWRGTGPQVPMLDTYTTDLGAEDDPVSARLPSLDPRRHK